VVAVDAHLQGGAGSRARGQHKSRQGAAPLGLLSGSSRAPLWLLSGSSRLLSGSSLAPLGLLSGSSLAPLGLLSAPLGLLSLSGSSRALSGSSRGPLGSSRRREGGDVHPLAQLARGGVRAVDASDADLPTAISLRSSCSANLGYISARARLDPVRPSIGLSVRLSLRLSVRLAPSVRGARPSAPARAPPRGQAPTKSKTRNHGCVYETATGRPSTARLSFATRGTRAYLGFISAISRLDGSIFRDQGHQGAPTVSGTGQGRVVRAKGPPLRPGEGRHGAPNATRESSLSSR
jgi:hypothetical protein